MMQHTPRVVLVTGGAGFVGSNLVRHLLATDAAVRVVVLDLFTYAANPSSLAEFASSPRFKLVIGDVCNESIVRCVLKEEHVDTVIHLAAESHVDRSIENPQPFISTNITGTAAVLQATRSAWPSFSGRRLHVVSTDEVFGSSSSSSASFTELCPFAPTNPYSATKAAADHLVSAWHSTYGLPTTISHASNNFGPWQFPEKLIPLIIQRALAGSNLPVYGDGTHVRDWVYVEDHCAAIDAIIRGGVPGTSYNIGARQCKQNIDVVRTVCRVLDRLQPAADGLPRECLITFVQDRPSHDRRYSLDPSKIMTELGWQPQVSFEAGIERTVRWYLANQQWVSEIVSGHYNFQRLGLLSSASPSPFSH